jgi:hypothetical protein
LVTSEVAPHAGATEIKMKYGHDPTSKGSTTTVADKGSVTI